MARQGRRRRQEVVDAYKKMLARTSSTPRRRAPCAARPPLRRAPALLAALFLVGTLAMVLLGIVGRLLDFNVPGTDAYAGYCMAARGLPRARAHAEARRAHPRHAAARALHGAGAARARARGRSPSAALLAALFAVLQLRLAWQSYALQRHLDRQRRDAAVDAAADDGLGTVDPARSPSSTSSCSSCAASASSQRAPRRRCTMNDAAITDAADRRAVRAARQRRVDRPRARRRRVDRHAAVLARARPATRWR